MAYYLAYGSNMNEEQMAQRCPTARLVGAVKLKGYRLAFMGKGGGAVATVQRDADSFVPAVVWDIRKSDEMALDRYEGYPYLYRKERAVVMLDKKVINAMMYVMNEKGHSYGVPGRYYYNIILDGYKSAGFPDTSLLGAYALSDKMSRA